MASRAVPPRLRSARHRLALSIVLMVAPVVSACSIDQESAPAATERATALTPPPKTPPTTNPVSTSATTLASPSSSSDLWDVVSVVDGDTIDVVRDGETVRVRVIGINAPERDECFYDEAAAGLGTLVPVDGVRLVTDTTDLDRFGRSLRFVETADGVDLGALLVESGLARSHHYPPDISRNADYDHLQEGAVTAEVGMWGSAACGGGASAGNATIGIDLQFDAPGDDNHNLNEEWVRFTNDGAWPVDLSGWQVADESSSHRYAIDDLVLEPGTVFVLYTGCGTDTALERYWCNTSSAVWNNSGDTVFLNDRAGNLLTSYTYRGD